MVSSPPSYQVAIIGAGFCGTMVAVQLADLVPGISLALIDQKDSLGPGLAYGTEDLDHLLNVRAGQMGAYPDEPEHFWRWLQSHKDLCPHHVAPRLDQFVPRNLYGAYLKDLWVQASRAHPSLYGFQKKIRSLQKRPDGGYRLISDDQSEITASFVVLALGNFPPHQLAHQSGLMNPYQAATWQELAGEGDILIVGTGLTSLDLVVTLSKIKSSGHIHLLSRHGLLPRQHTTLVPYALRLTEPYPTTALGLLLAMRREIAGASDIPWQSVVDAFRPLNQNLWQSLSLPEQRRFLRHLRAYWDVHRHRCAPEIMATYHKLEDQKRISVHHGHLLQQKASGPNWDVLWRPRGHKDTQTLKVRHVVRCTGPQSDIAKLDDPLVQNLLHEALMVPDDLHMGVRTDHYAVLDREGRPSDSLYTLGSLLKGSLYESIAVPELRGQAADVARRIAQKIS